MVVWWLASLAWAEPCPDRNALLDGLRSAVARDAMDEAETLRDDLVEAFACGTAAQPGELVGLWLAEATLQDRAGQTGLARDALRSASRLAPRLDEAWGADLRRRLEDTRRDPVLPSRLDVVASDPTYDLLLVDGLSFLPPDLLEAGPHLVQWGDTEEGMAGARIVRTEVDRIATIDVPYQGAGVPADSSKTRSDQRRSRSEKSRETSRRSPGLLVAAGVTGLGAIVTAGLAANAGPSANAPGVDVGQTLSRRFDQQRALGLTSFGLMAASTITLGVHVVR